MSALKQLGLRIPERFVEFVNNLAGSYRKTPSDVVREAIDEYSRRSPYQLQLSDYLSKGGKEVFVEIRANIARMPRNNADHETFERVALSALMRFWHDAYMKRRGYANPRYVRELLEITYELLLAGKALGLPLDYHYYYSRLGVKEDGQLQAVRDIAAQFSADPSATWAETLLRPIYHLADFLDRFDSRDIQRIFSLDRLQRLLPVATCGADAQIAEDVIARDMAQLLPSKVKFGINTLECELFADSFHLLVVEKHFLTLFGPDSLLSLAAFVENYSCSAIRGQKFFQFQTNKLQIRCMQDTAIIRQEHDTTSLHLSIDELERLCHEVRTILCTKEWDWVLDRFRVLRGDA